MKRLASAGVAGRSLAIWRIRRLVFVLLLGALAAGCGEADRRAAATPTVDLSHYGPRHAVARQPPPAPLVSPKPASGAVERELGAGVVGVVDASGNVGVRPTALETASDARLVRLQWSRWSPAGAEARGELRVLDCQPSCATGHTKRLPARVTLSGVRACAGRRYFGAAAVTLETGAPPTSYVRAPC
jgi:hypothetical protein